MLVKTVPFEESEIALCSFNQIIVKNRSTLTFQESYVIVLEKDMKTDKIRSFVYFDFVLFIRIRAIHLSKSIMPTSINKVTKQLLELRQDQHVL
jgi:hypothetical protein